MRERKREKKWSLVGSYGVLGGSYVIVRVCEIVATE